MFYVSLFIYYIYYCNIKLGFCSGKRWCRLLPPASLSSSPPPPLPPSLRLLLILEITGHFIAIPSRYFLISWQVSVGVVMRIVSSESNTVLQVLRI